MAVAIVVAAGSGERLGAGVPKALVPVAGRPMLEWSLAALAAVPAVTSIVVALPLGAEVALPAGVVAVPGGLTRSASVLAAAKAAKDGDPILVHDAARPLATPALFAAAIAELEATGADAVVTALPVVDTVKLVQEGSTRVQTTLDRNRLWAVQTPQVFRRSALEQALFGANAAMLAAATDDAFLIESAGGDVRVLAGEPDNFKITVASDLRAAELLLSQR